MVRTAVLLHDLVDLLEADLVLEARHDLVDLVRMRAKGRGRVRERVGVGGEA